MKRATIILVVLMLALASVAALAATPATTKASAKTTEAKTMTIQGEVVDMGCYLSQGAKGEQHKGCASMCINSGMPMGLLTNDGKLYLLTVNHDNADPYNSAKKLADEQVSVTGLVSERNGVKSISVNEVKELSAAKAQ